MLRSSVRRVVRYKAIRLWRIGFAVTAAVALGALSAGCTTTAETTGSTTAAIAAAPQGATVAFESVDGLPQYQFQKLVQSLQQEAETRQLAFVSRTGPAKYHVRGYASAHITKRQTTIAWVWDVYDNSEDRLLRISGEEQGANGRRGWAAANDQTMQRIARDGVTQLAGFLTGPQEPQAPIVTPPPVEANPVTSPEASPNIASTEGMTQQASLVSGQ